MPRFDSPGALSKVIESGTFTTEAFSFDELTLLESAPAAAQIDVRLDVLQFRIGPSSSDPTFSVTDETYGLDADDFNAFRSLLDAAFVGGADIAFNETDQTVTVPVPVSKDIPNGVVYNTQRYTKLYYVDPEISASTPLELRRSTNVTLPVIEFQPGSRLTSEMLNEARDQNLFAVQELTEFGALTGGSGGGGGGLSGTNIWDLDGAAALQSAEDGVVVWEGGQLNTSDDAQGVLPSSEGLVSGMVLITNSALSLDNKVEWVPLNSDNISVDVSGVDVPLTTILTDLNGKAQYFTDGGADPSTGGLQVNGGDANLVTVTATHIDLNGAVSVSDLNGGTPVTSLSSIDELSDVDTTTVAPELNAVLIWDGSNFVPSSPEVTVSLPKFKIQVSQGYNPPSEQGVYMAAGNSYYLGGSILDGTAPGQTLTLDGDTSNYNSSTGLYTVQVPGRYAISAMGTPGYESSENSRMVINLRKIRANGDGEAISPTAYTYSTSPNSIYQTASSTAYVDCEVGDQLGASFGSVSLNTGFYNGRLDIACIGAASVPVNVVSDQIIDSDVVNTLDRSTVLGVEKRVGITSDGKPVYSQLRRWSGAFAKGANSVLFNDFYVGKSLVSCEALELYNAEDGTLFVNEEIFAAMGFHLAQDGNDIRVYRSNNPANNANIVIGSYGRYEIKYTKDSDAAEETQTLVPTSYIDNLKIRADYSEPLTLANRSTYQPTLVGTTPTGNNVYEVYEEVTGSWLPAGGSQLTLVTNDFSNQSGAVNVESEIIRALDGNGGGSTEYRGQSSVSLFGFFIAYNAFGGSNELSLGRNGVASITSNFGAGSLIGIRTRYELP